MENPLIVLSRKNRVPAEKSYVFKIAKKDYWDIFGMKRWKGKGRSNAWER